jgi:hypothetical protein
MLELNHLLNLTTSPDPLLTQIRQSPAAPIMLNVLRQAVPDRTAIPQTTYTLYREFEHTGERDGFQRPYFLKRSQLTRAVFELIMGDESMRDAIHDLLWSICEETSWVLPAHEEQGPAYWELHPSPRAIPGERIPPSPANLTPLTCSPPKPGPAWPKPFTC